MTITVIQTGNCQLATGGTTTTGTGNFADAGGGDFGSALATNSAKFFAKGAAAAGADYTGTVSSVTNSDNVVVTPNFGTSLAGTAFWGIGTAQAGGTTTAVTIKFNSNVAAGNLLFIGISWDPSVSLAASNPITDSQGNTWVSCGALISNADYNMQSFVCTSALSSAANTVTVSFASAISAPALWILEAHTTVGTWSQDKFATGNGTNTACATSNFTTTSANELIVGFSGVDVHVTANPSGYTIEPGYDENNLGGAVSNLAGDSMAYKIVTSIQSGINVTWTQSSNQIFVVTAVTFAATSTPKASNLLTLGCS